MRVAVTRLSNACKAAQLRLPAATRPPVICAIAPRAQAAAVHELANVGQIRSYHFSQPVLAKGKKGGKGFKASDNDEPPALPDLKGIERKMEDRISRLVDEFSRIRGGRANADIFKDLKVDAFGSMTSLVETGQIVMTTPTKMTITTYDAALAVPVADAIRGCGLSLNPTTDGNKVTIVMPKPSAEARDNLVKLAGKAAEKFKQEVRQGRKDGMDAIKKIKSKLPEDATRRFTKELETLTERKVDAITKLLKDKEKEIRAD